MSQAKLNSWVKKLSTQNLPVLNTVVVEINKLSGSEEADANRLAEIILKDPNLTSHVLKVANSVQYNYSKVAINTVSRAVVLIGLKGMRAICISLLVLESLLKNKPKDRVMLEESKNVWNAIQSVFAQGYSTPDLSKPGSGVKMINTDAFGDKVVEALLAS